MLTMDERRQAAIKQLNEKQNFRSHLTTFAIINTMLILVWALTGAGYFWPVWPIAGWGIGLALHAYRVYFGPKPLSETEIQAEMDRDERRTSRYG